MAVPDDSIVALLRTLVRTPSRAGVDAPQPVLQAVEAWLGAQGLGFERLLGAGGQPLGLYAEVRGRRPGDRWTVLDATLDTAGFGDPATWTHPPTSATVAEGWLHGRGSGDSKAGAAIFAHLLRAFGARADDFGGRIGLLLDLDEHSGGFAGARAFFEPRSGPAPRPDGVLIGYPGLDRIVAGSRGFSRARLTVHGQAAHSGSAHRRGLNAIDRALDLAAALREAGAALPPADPAFGLPPTLTLTRIQGGESFAQVPDRCTLDLDLRLTPTFPAEAARRLVDGLAAHQDLGFNAPPTTLEWTDGWPAFRVPDTHPLLQALGAAAEQELGHPVPTTVAGPSNIGNYLATLGIPTLAGFGVTAEHLHAANERIHLASIPPAYRTYEAALLHLHT